MPGNEVVIHVREEGTAQTGASLSKFQALAVGAAAGVGVAFVAMGAKVTGAVVDAFGEAVKAAEDLRRVQTQTAAALQSTAGVSGMTAGSIRDLASSLETLTGVDEIAIQTGENMLLTFTNIGRGIFPDVTKAVIDMATAMNGGLTPSASELSQTAIQVGKALNDPIEGVTALQRVGVKLTDQQKDLVESLVKSGDGAKAQALILQELQTEFGGSAEAATKARGGVDQARDAFEDAARDLATQLLPHLDDLKGKLYNAAAAVLNSDGLKAGLSAALDGFVKIIEKIPAVISQIGDLIGALHDLGTALNNLGPAGDNGRPGLAETFFNALTLSELRKRAPEAARAALQAFEQAMANAGVQGEAFWGPNGSPGAALRGFAHPSAGVVEDNAPNVAGWVPNIAAAVLAGAGGANNFNLGPSGGGKDPLTAAWEQINSTLLDELIRGGEDRLQATQEEQAKLLEETVNTATRMADILGVDLAKTLIPAFETIRDREKEAAEIRVKTAKEAAEQLIKWEKDIAAERLSLTQKLWSQFGGGQNAQVAGNLALLAAAAAAGDTTLGGNQAAANAILNGGGTTVINNFNGVVGDPVATGQAVAAALNAAGQNGPVINSGAVG